jgi:hypothetical protein
VKAGVWREVSESSPSTAAHAAGLRVRVQDWKGQGGIAPGRKARVREDRWHCASSPKAEIFNTWTTGPGPGQAVRGSSVPDPY